MSKGSTESSGLAQPQAVTIEFEHKNHLNTIRTDLSSDNRLPVKSLQSRLMVTSFDLVSINGKPEQHGRMHLAYTTTDGLSLRTFAAGDVIHVTGVMQNCCCGG